VRTALTALWSTHGHRVLVVSSQPTDHGHSVLTSPAGSLCLFVCLSVPVQDVIANNFVYPVVVSTQVASTRPRVSASVLLSSVLKCTIHQITRGAKAAAVLLLFVLMMMMMMMMIRKLLNQSISQSIMY